MCQNKFLKNLAFSVLFVTVFCINLGMPLPSENDLRIKVGLPVHRKFVIGKEESKNDDDETWRPYKPKVKKPALQSN